jgi:L-threonylcarbamoyladenylate synthase
MSRIDQETQKCLPVLQSGGILLYPTDTIWGIGCDATSQEAVDKVYLLKRRVESKSMIILLDSFRRIREFVAVIPEIARDLVSNNELPLTVIYPGAKNLAPGVIADDGSIAIRIVRDPFCRKLIRAFGKPIVSTSANISGEAPPLTYKHISRAVTGGVDYIVDPSLARITSEKPSRIIKLETNGEFRIIRK